jgi:hypothetical protein
LKDERPCFFSFPLAGEGRVRGTFVEGTNCGICRQCCYFSLSPCEEGTLKDGVLKRGLGVAVQKFGIKKKIYELRIDKL